MRIPPGLILLGFIATPLLELYLLIKIGGEIGALFTIALVLLTAVIGVNLLRQQGMSTLQRAQQKMHEGGIPAGEMLEGLALLIAGAFLLTPGFVTDTLGFLLLIPPSRQAILRWLISRGLIRLQTPPSNPGQPGGPPRDSIDAESWREER